MIASETMRWLRKLFKRKLPNPACPEPSTIRMQGEQLHIVLAADFGYQDKVLTTLKSILYHQSNVQFYLLNNHDYPDDWFQNVNAEIEPLNAHIQNVPILQDWAEQNFKTIEHISQATFYRYFIPQKIQAAKVLYLDSDLIVNGDLSAFYQTDLGTNFVAAVKDNFTEFHRGVMNFNAGVLLINNDLWRQENIFQAAFQLHATQPEKLIDADQSVLNILFEGRWKIMSYNENYQVGWEYMARRKGFLSTLPKTPPLIVHYNTALKPWHEKHPKGLDMYRQLWWFYHHLTFDELRQRHRAAH